MNFSMPSFLLLVKIIPNITLQTKWALQLLLLFDFVPLRLHSSHARYAMSSSCHPSYNLIGTVCNHSPLYYHIKNISAYLHALWLLCSAVASFASKRFLHNSFIFLIHFSLHFFFFFFPSRFPFSVLRKHVKQFKLYMVYRQKGISGACPTGNNWGWIGGTSELWLNQQWSTNS